MKLRAAEGYARDVRADLTPEHAAEVAAVDELAGRLRAHVNATAEEIGLLHVHGAPSKMLSAHFARPLRDHLGLAEEVVLTTQTGLVTQAQPDIFRLAPDRGVIAEVERGGATTNNHDLKDLWKAHVAPDAHPLFLLVPHHSWRADGSPRERPFQTVARRLGAFFGDPRREIDVLSSHIFAY